MRFALTLAALLAASVPALAGIIEDPVTHFRTYVPDPSPIGTAGGAGITFPTLQPTWIAPPAQYLQPPPRLQTTCYTIGNIITCY
jgi:hypothetical protein